MTRVVHVLPDAESAATAVVDRLFGLASRVGEQERPFALAISGGRTPEPMFRALAIREGGPKDWSRWQLFWCDERLVPGSDPRSNFGLAQRLWLGPAHFPPRNIHPIETGVPVDEAARRYETTVRGYFGAGDAPTFDAVVLGVGPDGHTASLFPGASALEVVDRWVVPEPRPSQPPAVPRVTLTLEGIGRARTAIFLVGGADKRPVLAEILGAADGTATGPKLPAARVRAQDAVEWFVDSAAAPTSSSR